MDNAGTITAAAGGAVLLWCAKQWSDHIQLAKGDPESSLPMPPGDMGLPLIGIGLRVWFFRRKKKRLLLEDEWVSKYGHTRITHLFGYPLVITSSGEGIKKILSSENKLVETSFFDSTLDLFGKFSLFSQRGTKHAASRATIMNSFAPQTFARQIPVVEEVARKHLREWEAQDTPKLGLGFHAFTFELIGKLSLGMSDEDCIAQDTNPVWTMFNDWINGITAPPFYVFEARRKGLTAREFLDDFVRKIITYRLEHGKPPPGQKEVLLDDLIKLSGDQKWSADELVDQSLLQLFAGFNNTAVTLSAFVSFVGVHPHIQDKLRAEQLEVRPDRDEPIAPQHHRASKYLEQTIKESMRYMGLPAPAVPPRKVLKTFEIDGFQVPKGWSCSPAMGTAARHCPDWKDPDKFDPDRFGPERHEGRNNWWFKPFGSGGRLCVGQMLAWAELHTMLSILVRDYTWKPLSYPPEWQNPLTPNVADGLPVIMCKREDVR